jgi:hypothetical protein
MEKRKFNDGEKVRYNGCTYTIKEAHYMYYPNGSWWEYYLLDGEKVVRVGEKLLDGIVTPPTRGNAVRGAKKDKKQKKKNYGNKTKEA